MSHQIISGATALVSVLLMTAFARGDTGNHEMTDAARASARFAKLVETADKARLARRHKDAFIAYNEALEIRGDAAVAGRLGLVVLAMGDYPAAAEYLLHAITKAQAPPYLMKQFHDGFARVRPKVCFVEVFVSESDAQVDIDGVLESSTGHNAFHVFVTAGSHTFQAKLEGFEDATETIDAAGGGDGQVRLELKPLPPPPPVQEEPTPNPITKPGVVDKPTHRLSESHTDFYVGAGGILMLGATPGVAVGPQIIGGVRRGFVSVNLDARLAGSIGTLESAPDLQFMTWAVGLRPCAHYTILYGCVLLQASGMKSLSEDDRWQNRFGGGLHAGLDLLVRAPVHLQLWGEGVVLSNGYTVAQNGNGLWAGLPIWGGFGATALLTW